MGKKVFGKQSITSFATVCNYSAKVAEKGVERMENITYSEMASILILMTGIL